MHHVIMSSQIVLLGRCAQKRFGVDDGSWFGQWLCEPQMALHLAFHASQMHLGPANISGCMVNLKHATAACMGMLVWMKQLQASMQGCQASMQGCISTARTLLAGPFWLAFFLSECTLPSKKIGLKLFSYTMKF